MQHHALSLRKDMARPTDAFFMKRTSSSSRQETRSEDGMPAATLPNAAFFPDSSPFLLSLHDVDALSQSQGFMILRAHLANHYKYDLCDAHRPALRENLDRWLTVRDVLHALLVPIVELFDRACTVASQATRATKLEQLEYAFSGPARSAFVWLQCFLSSAKERDWCYTRGCPVCVVDHSLDSEFSIRLLYAACLLSDVHYPFTLEGPTLPSFTFFLDSLARAIQTDPLFGDDFFELMQPKAMQTVNGVEDLMRQCLDLDVAMSAASTPSDPSSPDASAPGSPVLAPLGGTPNGMRVKRSKMARRQMRVKVEEEQWMQEMVKKCWDQLQPPTADAAQETDGEMIPTQSLDAVLKAEPVVAVKEVAPS